MEHFAWIVLVAISSGFGGFIGAYLKKKAENLAAHEDFKILLAQQQATTEATKAIEARISIDVWSQQQRWDVQKTALLDSLKELATAETFLFRLVSTFRDTTDQSGDWAERRKEANEKYDGAPSTISGERNWPWKSYAAGPLVISFRRSITYSSERGTEPDKATSTTYGISNTRRSLRRRENWGRRSVGSWNLIRN
jgi:hypothetical protein